MRNNKANAGSGFKGPLKNFEGMWLTAPRGQPAFTRMGPANHHEGYFESIISPTKPASEHLYEEIMGKNPLCSFCNKQRTSACSGHRIGMILPFYYIFPPFAPTFVKFLNGICLNVDVKHGNAIEFSGCCCPRSSTNKTGTFSERVSVTNNTCKFCGISRAGKYSDSRFILPKATENDGGIRYIWAGEELFIPLNKLMTYMFYQNPADEGPDRLANLTAARVQFEMNSDPINMVSNILYVMPYQLRPERDGKPSFETKQLLAVYEECRIVANTNPKTVGTATTPGIELSRQEMLQIFRHIDKLLAKKPRTPDAETALHRLNGKHGVIRQFVIGAHTWNEGRSVVIPSIGNIGEFGISRYFQSLTTIETANSYNIGRLRQLAKHRLVAYIRRYGSTEVVRFSLDATINIGDDVFRNVIEGDLVIGNRQPTLHRWALMGHHLKYTNGAVLRLNRSETTPLNADFDGDEMTVHAAMTAAGRIELTGHAHVVNNVRESGLPSMAVVFHELAVMLILSIRAPEMVKDPAKYLASFTGSFDFERRKKSYVARRADIIARGFVKTPEYVRALAAKYGADETGISPNFPLSWPLIVTYRDVISLLFSEDFTYKRSGICVMDGVFVSGEFAKANIGLSSGSVVHILHPSKRAALFINDVSRICDVFMASNGISFDINDMIYPAAYYQEISEIMSKMRPVLEESLQKKAAAVSQFEKDQIERSISLLTTAPAKHIMKTIEQTRLAMSAKLNALSKDATPDEREVVLQEIRDKRVGNVFEAMCISGCRGSTTSMMQMSMNLGSQYVGNERSNLTKLPWMNNPGAFPGPDGRPAQTALANGIVESSFLGGLTPEEYFAHSDAARVSIIVSKLGIADSGYVARVMNAALAFTHIAGDLKTMFGFTVVSDSLGGFIDSTQHHATTFNGRRVSSFVDIGTIYHSTLYEYKTVEAKKKIGTENTIVVGNSFGIGTRVRVSGGNF